MINIEELNNLIDQYDSALVQTLIERDNEDSKALAEYHTLASKLEQFAKDNPTWKYQRHLTKERADHLGYYYSDRFILSEEAIYYRRKARLQLRDEARLNQLNDFANI